MKGNHPNQLEIDFTIPAKKLLSVADISKAVGLSSSKILQAINNWELVAINISSKSSEREEWRVPLQNYVDWLNNTYTEDLQFKFPSKEWLTIRRTAIFLSCSQQHVHDLMHDKEFPCAVNIARPGKQKSWRIPKDDLVDFVTRRNPGAIA